ncbi:MAG: GDP-mannose 4,6-dehydratase, partial [Candidatus Omnitrophica bacterium]|nr:GDP-mannose 4,6-dehydratase [Candidatus Omnitrophota bacterium]
MKNKSILITGGAGFIGSEFVRQAVKKGYFPIVVDKLTYAGDLKRLQGLSPKGTVPDLIVVDKLTYAGDLKRLQGLSPKGTVPDFKFYKADICDKKRIELIFKKEKPEVVTNFAAETHV